MTKKIKTINLKIDANGYAHFKEIMKKMGFSNESYFLMYCTLNTIKSKYSGKEKNEILKEMKELKNAKKKS